MKPHRKRSRLPQSQAVTPVHVRELAALFNSAKYPALEVRARQLATLHPGSGLAWKFLSVALVLQGKDALHALQRTTECLPDDAEAHSNLGNALRGLGQFDAALVSCSRALQIQPQYAEAHSNLGNALLAQGQFEAAVASYRRALEIKPEFADARCNLGNALLALGQLEAAAASYRRAVQTKPEFAEAHSNLGNALHALGQFEAAAASYRRAVQIKPDFAEAHSNLGNVLRCLGQFDAALVSCRGALEIKPHYAEAHSNLGNVLRGLGRHGEAVASYCRALQIKPQYAEAHCNLSDALLELDRVDEAVASCRRALQINPRYAEAHSNLGNALRGLGQHDEAVGSYRRAVEIKANFAAAHNNLGSALLELGQIEAALSSCSRALEIDPQFAEAYNNLGIALNGLGRLDEALTSFRRALDIKPDFAEAHNGLGNLLQDLEQPDAAVASYRRARQIKPRYAEAHVNLGIALKRLSRTEEAQVSCHKALDIEPDAAMALVLLASLRADRGQFAEAEALYQRAVSTDPNLPEAWSGIPRVRTMTVRDAAWLAEAQRVAGLRLPPRKEAQLRFAIGKYFDDVNDFEQAFTQYRRANELSKRCIPTYDEQRVTQTVDQILEFYDRAWLNRMRIDANTSARPVFIVGMPRSGTTLAEQILASHPAVYGAGELTFWTTASAVYQSAAHDGSASADVLQGLANEYLWLLEDQSAEALRVADKMPANFQHLGLIHAALPNARIIHMQRNPVDTCLSIHFQNFGIAHSYAADLNDLAHYYGEYRRVMGYWRLILPAEAILEVPYEGLVEDQEGWSRKMIDFIGLPWDARCLDFHQTSRTVLTASSWQVRQKINRSSVARWRNYESFVGPLLHLMEAAAGG